MILLVLFWFKPNLSQILMLEMAPYPPISMKQKPLLNQILLKCM